MAYTPVELRHVRIERALFGYRRRTVEQLIDEVADSFEEVWRGRGDLADRLEEVERQLAELREREQLLANTLVAAEQAAVDLREQAKRDAELIVGEAHQEARSITRTAAGERERLFTEGRRIEALLRSALGLVDEAVDPEELEDESEIPEVESWPQREDTREFKLEAPLPPAEESVVAGTDLVPIGGANGTEAVQE